MGQWYVFLPGSPSKWSYPDLVLKLKAHTVEVVRQFERTVRDEASCNPAIGKFVLLHRTSVQLSPSIIALGCTFWSHLAPDIAEFTWAVTDFKRIQDMDPEMYDNLHKGDHDWLQAEIARIRTEAPDQAVVVLTHHAPTREGTSDPKFAGGPTESAFVSEHSQNSLLWGPPIKVWAFGHTHWCCDFERNGVRLLSNQRGYKYGRENSTRLFDPGFVLEV